MESVDVSSNLTTCLWHKRIENLSKISGNTMNNFLTKLIAKDTDCRAYKFHVEDFIFDVKVCMNGAVYEMQSKCYPSMKKKLKPHEVLCSTESREHYKLELLMCCWSRFMSSHLSPCLQSGTLSEVELENHPYCCVEDVS